MAVTGNQELLILLTDVSESMYCHRIDDDNAIPVPKHAQLQSAISALISKINGTDKSDHILIAIIPFAEDAVVIKPVEAKYNYYHSKEWLKEERLKTLFADIEYPKNTSLRDTLGWQTSFTSAFSKAKEVLDDFWIDRRIHPDNRYGVTIMFFSDGQNYPENENLMSELDTIINPLRLDVETKLSTGQTENFSICTVAIGKDADIRTLKIISSPYTIKQSKHIQKMRSSNVHASMLVNDVRCHLKLNAQNETIDEDELIILRKFLFLVTDTDVA